MDCGDLKTMSDALNILTKKAGDTISTYGPEAFKIAEQYEHSLGIIHWITCIVASIIFGAVSIYLFNRAVYCYKFLPKNSAGECSPLAIMFSIFGGVSVLIFIGFFFGGVLNATNLLGVFSPNIAVIHAAVGIATGN